MERRSAKRFSASFSTPKKDLRHPSPGCSKPHRHPARAGTGGSRSRKRRAGNSERKTYHKNTRKVAIATLRLRKHSPHNSPWIEATTGALRNGRAAYFLIRKEARAATARSSRRASTGPGLNQKCLNIHRILYGGLGLSARQEEAREDPREEEGARRRRRRRGRRRK